MPLIVQMTPDNRRLAGVVHQRCRLFTPLIDCPATFRALFFKRLRRHVEQPILTRCPRFNNVFDRLNRRQLEPVVIKTDISRITHSPRPTANPTPEMLLCVSSEAIQSRPELIAPAASYFC